MTLILPDSLILKPPRPVTTFGGEYRFRILDEHGNLKRETDWSDNLVTNFGLDVIGGGTGALFATFCRIGTGNTTPAYTDTALVAQSASTNTIAARSSSNAGASTYETNQTITYQFALGAVVGNMAEVGVGTTASGATLCSRALIVDSGGSPTTITVLVSEILQVVYRFTCFPNLTDSTGSVTIGGVSYAYTARAFDAGTPLGIDVSSTHLIVSASSQRVYNGGIAAVTAASPTGSSSAFGATTTFAAYTTGNYYRDLTISAGLTEGNVAGGITAIAFAVGGTSTVFNTQFGFGTAIPKDSTKVMSITFRQFFSHH